MNIDWDTSICINDMYKGIVHRVFALFDFGFADTIL